jgi:hypothetical protein
MGSLKYDNKKYELNSEAIAELYLHDSASLEYHAYDATLECVITAPFLEQKYATAETVLSPRQSILGLCILLLMCFFYKQWRLDFCKVFIYIANVIMIFKFSITVVQSFNLIKE